MENWVVLRKGADFVQIGKKYGISPVVARLIRNREITGDEQIRTYLYGTINDLYDGILMKDMRLAAEITLEKIRDGASIRIIGDYDIDGINATYILLEGLEKLGASVDVDIPDRMKDGYGLNRTLIERAAQAGVDTIITCDNGIAAREEIAYAKSLGMTVIVTDHHEVPFEEQNGRKTYIIPPADAVVDPKQEDCTYPFPELCGAAVAYKFVEVLYEISGRDVEDLDYLMENVAIATVGDVMDLTGENRIFVRQGLDMLKRTSNCGLKALIDCNGIDVNRLNTYHIGFVLGPCLNASGRLDTAKRSLALLRAKTQKEADILAGDLKALNDSRKDLTEAAVEQAKELVETTGIGKDRVLVIYLPECHESLAGIVAGRIRETYHRPTFVLTDAEEGVKGSGRSIETYHMYEKLNECKELLRRFGGHKMAAGLSLDACNIEPLRQMLNEKSGLQEADLAEKITIDMPLPFSYISAELIDQMNLLEPFGKGNTRPLFAEKDLSVVEHRVVGKNQNAMKLRVRDAQGAEMDAIFFGDVEALQQTIEEKRGRGLSFTYYPTVNSYMGRKTLQITVQNFR